MLVKSGVMSTKVNRKIQSSKSGTKNHKENNGNGLTNGLVNDDIMEVTKHLVNGEGGYLRGALVGGCLAPSDNMVTDKQGVNVNGLSISELYIQGIDYLTVYLTGTKKGRSRKFKLTDLQRDTRLYEKVYLIIDEVNNVKVGEICKNPKSPILPKGSCSLKFDNQILYLKFFNFKYCERLFKALGCEYKNVTRLDVYRDLQRFKDFIPGELVKKYAKNEYLSASRGKMKYDEIGSDRAEGREPEYLRKGKKNSGRQFYLYNKSRELQEVGDKEHIRETWKKAGFVPGVDMWRLEMSVTKGKRNMVLFQETGDLIEIQLREVFKNKFLKMLYDSGLKSSFRFVENTNTRKTNCKEVVLFRGQGKNIKLVRGVGQTDNLRMRKIIVKKEIRDLLKDRETREHKTRGIQERIDWVNNYVIDHNMSKYLLKIIYSLALEFKTESFGDLGKFVYNYFGKKGGLL